MLQGVAEAVPEYAVKVAAQKRAPAGQNGEGG
jgi:hypothetical protein